MAWLLDINGTSKTLAAWYISSIKLEFVNRAASTLTILPVEGSGSATAIMTYGDTVKLYEDTTCRFWGTCLTSPIICLPGQKINRVYTVQDAFFRLAKEVYEQDWHEDTENTKYRGRVQLARDVNGAKVSVGASIEDILGYAIGAGVELQYVGADLDALTTIAPDNEVVDLTCLEAIQNVLNWAPSVATRIDYSTTPYPTIRFIRRADAITSGAVEIASDDMDELRATPRNDLQIDGVILSFEKTSTVDGETYTTTEQQTAGNTTTGINIIRQTIDLEGMSSSHTDQEATVETSDEVDPSQASFWTTWTPMLSKVSGLTVANSSGPDAATLEDYPRVLTAGTVPVWTGKVCTTGKFYAELSFTYNGRKIVNLPTEIELTLTDAETETYSQIISSSYKPGETVPAGLAASILAERSTLHYEGYATDKNTSGITLSPTTTDVINFTNEGHGIDGLDDINAVVESVSYVFDGRVSTRTISFGPPKRLGPQDYISIIRASRTLRESTWNRKDPASSSGNAIDASGPGPKANSIPLGDVLPPATSSTTQYMALMLDASGATAGRAWLDRFAGISVAHTSPTYTALCRNKTTGVYSWREIEYGIKP
jgi:hypothetical protein